MTRNIREADGLLMKTTDDPSKLVPADGERNVLITSALPYCNNVPHLGNIIGSTLSADVFASRNFRTLYVCGTDEYGTATETQALKEGISPKELCDKYNAIHEETYKWFDIGFDHFGRTSTPSHTEVNQEAYLRLYKNGFLQKQVKPQTYCEGCSKFLADRFVEGTCPNCGYDDARGDQCDFCSRTLDAVDLINPRCLVNKTHTITTKPSTHMYVKLDAIQPKLEPWIKKTWKEGRWAPNVVINGDGEIVDTRFKAGLRPSPITRDLTWGVQVPKTGGEEDESMAGKVLYVWFDAPFGYPSITASFHPDWRKWWFNPENVKYYEFMGKDNVYFHTVLWPSVLLADGRPWTMLHHVSSTEYLQYESGKFSKSRGIGVFGPAAATTGVPSSVWRYYLLSSRPETGDSAFSWNDFIAANNNILLNNFGNFVNRVIKFVSSKFKGVIPDSGEKPGVFENDPTAGDADPDTNFLSDINKLFKEYIDTMDAVKIRSGLHLVMQVSARGNQYLQETTFFKLYDSNPGLCAKVISRAINLIYALTALVHPFMPATSDEILRQLNAPARTVPTHLTNDLLAGHEIGTPEYLFKKIEEKNAEVWRVQFGGVQTNAAAPEKTAAPGAAAPVDAAGKPVSKRAQAKAKKDAAAASAASSGPKSPEEIELESQIKSQGDKVRRIKGGSAEESDGPLEDAIAQLQKLKLDLQNLVSTKAA
ncbi:methionyl-tRNA synthetase [Clavulina sp. PMI_390]|nr:methionyl-tRNA synthetase [Clavulina sp. PMI_390]